MAVAFYRHYPTCPLGIGAAGSKGVANISFFFSFSHLVPFFFALSNPLDQLLAGCQPCWPSGFDRALATACTRGKNSLSLSASRWRSLLCVPIQWLPMAVPTTFPSSLPFLSAMGSLHLGPSWLTFRSLFFFYSFIVLWMAQKNSSSCRCYKFGRNAS